MPNKDKQVQQTTFKNLIIELNSETNEWVREWIEDKYSFNEDITECVKSKGLTFNDVFVEGSSNSTGDQFYLSDFNSPYDALIQIVDTSVQQTILGMANDFKFDGDSELEME
ncbi:hypothetical protein [Williamsoniiplasma lucivorax]|uniref:Uncharacterized protein n=1 Tax=Williamsoniiplasma lucivorax TaxID=209274 RepID=A0A2S5RDI9_9MOLU|nr:hypothetical protein [Williamsoniiplasma lucivorax]PPE05409.1 hypothetical protein ELUCI_v1c05010 [Williamsoniiplasma lucivorax]